MIASLFGHADSGNEFPHYSHDFKMSICEIVQTPANNSLEIRFYLFQDDFKLALYGNSEADDISEADAQKYISQQTRMSLNGSFVEPIFKSMEWKDDQVKLIYQIEHSQNQRIKKIDLTNRLLTEHFRTQVNMVYFVKSDGEKLVQMLDVSRTEAGFEL